MLPKSLALLGFAAVAAANSVHGDAQCSKPYLNISVRRTFRFAAVPRAADSLLDRVVIAGCVAVGHPGLRRGRCP